jgi:hypothetical protein
MLPRAAGIESFTASFLARRKRLLLLKKKQQKDRWFRVPGD